MQTQTKQLNELREQESISVALEFSIGHSRFVAGDSFLW